MPAPEGLEALSPEQVRDAVVRAIASVTERDVDTITDDLPLTRLGFDSLMFTSLLIDVEELLGVELPPELLADLAESRQPSVVRDLIEVFEPRRGAA